MVFFQLITDNIRTETHKLRSNCKSYPKGRIMETQKEKVYDFITYRIVKFIEPENGIMIARCWRVGEIRC